MVIQIHRNQIWKVIRPEMAYYPSPKHIYIYMPTYIYIYIYIYIHIHIQNMYSIHTYIGLHMDYISTHYHIDILRCLLPPSLTKLCFIVFCFKWRVKRTRSLYAYFFYAIKELIPLLKHFPNFFQLKYVGRYPSTLRNDRTLHPLYPVTSPWRLKQFYCWHYIDFTMTMMASQITSLTVVYSTVYSDADQRKHQSSASLAYVLGIHRDRWIPRTKGQLRGKCFHLMTSSWVDHDPWITHEDIMTWERFPHYWPFIRWINR